MNLDAGNIINIITALTTLSSAGFLLYKFRKGDLPKLQQDGAGVITQASLQLVQEIKAENKEIHAKMKEMEKERTELLGQVNDLKEQLELFVKGDLRIVMVIGDRPIKAKSVQISYVKPEEGK